MTDTLADALPAEIARVRVIQDHYKELNGMPHVMVGPIIMMIEAEIQTAIRAAASGDVVQMIRSLQSLRGYKE